MQEIDIFVQHEGHHGISIIHVKQDATIEELAVAAIAQGPSHGADSHEYQVSLEETEEALAPGTTLAAAGIVHRSRIHLHRCHKVEVTVSFNGKEKSHPFSPATTMSKVTQWAVGKRGFDLDPVDAAEHVLQITGTSIRPDEDAHLGTLVIPPACVASFDLVPKQRVEG